MMQKMFDVNNIELKGLNLIEASAGTGKTYSIAILVLRLLLEKRIPLSKILMVTFTNKAVAELELRIRKFIRLAYRSANGTSCDDKMINNIVNNAIENSDKFEVCNLLNKALGQFDEVQVFTIHGFCQQAISQYTFETNQTFDQEIISSIQDVLEKTLAQFRREVINTIPGQDLFDIVHEKLKYKDMALMATKALDNKIFIDGQGELVNLDISVLFNKRQKLTEEIELIINRDFEKIQKLKLDGRKPLDNSIKKGKDKFLEYCLNNTKLNDISKLETFSDLYRSISEYLNVVYYINNRNLYYYNRFIDYAKEKVTTYKVQTGKITYDDLIRNIKESVLENESFRKIMADKYDAVFIDEFQDTDALQYAIFQELYGKAGKIVFYIGDPKQSIYGWRKADLEVYKKAKSEVNGNVFSMNNNYRSTEDYIKAINLLMGKEMSGDLFLDNQIEYQDVNAGNENIGALEVSGNKIVPIELIETIDEDLNIEFVCSEIKRLLTDENIKITRKNISRRISPSDIGIIVRKNNEGIKIKEALLKAGIPAIAKDKETIFSSREADYILYLLEAILEPTRGKINRVLFRKYFGFSLERINKLHIDQHADVFRTLHTILRELGIYNMMQSFLSIYGIRSICTQNLNGERVLTNVLHITEILHEAEKKNQLSPEALIGWLLSARKENENDEYQKRIESEENAVEVITIHSCKGLSYNILFAPYLNGSKEFKSGKLYDFKKGDQYYFTLKYNANPEIEKIIKDTEEQEARRLFYVTMTRPVFKCYVSWVKTKEGGRLDKIIHADLRNNQHNTLISYRQVEKNDILTGFKNLSKHELQTITVRKPDANRRIDVKTGMYSFSSLSLKHYQFPFEVGDSIEDYERFVFNELPRGTQPGLFLHSIFEELNFAAPDSYESTLKQVARMYPNQYDEEKHSLLLQLVNEVMNAPLLVGFDKSLSLKEVNENMKRSEIEFFFQINNCDRKRIADLFPEVELKDGTLNGHINGFIDLLFKHGGKYYILDWKSNYLGSHIDDYSQEKIKEAMTLNNYHLQYLLYTVAATRFLRQMIPDFDYDTHFGGVIYLFMRGIRCGTQNGMFFKLPDRGKIEQLESVIKY